MVRRPAAGQGAGQGPIYVLEEQVGHLLRRAHQRATVVFQEHLGDAGLTPLQFAALVKIRDEGKVSQNRLGRLSAMDPATTMGVIRRLDERELIRRDQDPNDRRRTTLRLTAKGLALVEELEVVGFAVSDGILDPLDDAEQETFLRLLKRLT